MPPAELASVVIVAAGIGYLLSLLLNIPAGFPMPPHAATRVVASISVLASAPALAVFAYSMRVACSTRATNIAFALAVIFAMIAVANRLTQLFALQTLPQLGLPQLDLYVTNSFAQSAEMLAWGWLFGAVTLLLVRAVASTAGTWPARLYGAAGLMAITAGLIYAVAIVAGLPEWLGGVGVAVGGLAWGIVWPASAGLFSLMIRSRRATA